ncbi:glucose 1-dehydrogenase [Desemzia sp. RIT804]|uniref:glucose 1-dehydrogenase n=1 Tax=Desemzia sp. RIT 804 TaxID=2810209 RepID=UPI001950E755|nr:glucose 1-dehydrogenase [Desemzia sp. RIT 804]MBM6614845.1 glucose 1-dehydrogenase [Desemzia sp. RIT 804]
MNKLDGKVVLVTGAASGIGKSIAELYATEGAKVVLADLNFEVLESVTKEIVANGGDAIAVRANMVEAADVESMINTAINKYGTLDILVNNAGIMDGFEPVGEITDEKWDHIFAVNTKGVMRSMRKSVNYWLENNKQGNIINVISTGGLNGAHAGVAYSASKHAVVALTKNTAYMYAQSNIRVNGIAPGAIATNISHSMTDVSEFGAIRTKFAHGAIPSIGHPEDIGTVAVFLGSEESKFLNGAIITADGGWTAAF